MSEKMIEIFGFLPIRKIKQERKGVCNEENNYLDAKEGEGLTFIEDTHKINTPIILVFSINGLFKD